MDRIVDVIKLNQSRMYFNSHIPHMDDGCVGYDAVSSKLIYSVKRCMAILKKRGMPEYMWLDYLEECRDKRHIILCEDAEIPKREWTE